MKVFDDENLKLIKVDELNLDRESAVWVSILSLTVFIFGSIFVGFLYGNLEFHVSGFVAILFIVAFAITQLLVLIIHELIHGLTSQKFGHKASYGFMFLYKFFPVGYTHSKGFFEKREFYIILLSPFLVITLFGSVFAFLFFNNLIAFYLISLFTVSNLAGSVGDMFIAYKLYAYPSSIILENKELKDPLFIWSTTEITPGMQKYSLNSRFLKTGATFIISLIFCYLFLGTLGTYSLMFLTPVMKLFNIESLTIFGWLIIANSEGLSVETVNQLDLMLLALIGSGLITLKYHKSNTRNKKTPKEAIDDRQASIPFIA